MTYLILVSFVWAFSFPLIKGHLTGLDPNFVSFARMLLSLLVFLPFLRFGGLSKTVGLKLAVTGAVQFGLMYIAYITAFQFLPAHTIVLLTTTTPLFVTLFNDLHGRKFNALFFAAASMAFLGGAVIKYPDQPLRASLMGIVLVQISNVAFAFGQIYYKQLSAKHSTWSDRSVFGFLYLGAVVLTALFSLFTTPFSRLQVTVSQGLVLVYLGIIASGICFFLWNKGARYVNEGMLAILNNLKIPLGILASLILLGESTDYLRLVVGFGLMVGAAYLCERPGHLAAKQSAYS
ncbi:MAG: EamA family transporter [Desulfobacterota bacterium]|nr:EamA family transporter [Thermodesulfobacteriota bacterium]